MSCFCINASTGFAICNYCIGPCTQDLHLGPTCIYIHCFGVKVSIAEYLLYTLPGTGAVGWRQRERVGLTQSLLFVTAKHVLTMEATHQASVALCEDLGRAGVVHSPQAYM